MPRQEGYEAARADLASAPTDGSTALQPGWLTIPPDQRSGFSYESLVKSYRFQDRQSRGNGGRVVGGDEAAWTKTPNWYNPNAESYVKMFGPAALRKSYQNAMRYQNGRGLDFERAMASGNLGAGYSDGTALATLNLDATMTSVLYESGHLVMWNWLNRSPSINPLYQWTERDTYGSIRGGFGFAQGGIPKTGVAAWTRNQATVCFFGVRRGITDVEAQSGLLGGVMVDPVQEEDRDGAFETLGRAELNFTFADPRVTDNYGNTVNYPGTILQMTDTSGSYAYGSAPLASNVLDKQGGFLDFTDLNNIAAVLYQNGKLQSFANLRAFLCTSTLQDLSNLKAYIERRMLAPTVPNGPQGFGYTTGEPLPGHATNFGVIPFTASIFLDEVPNGQAIIEGPADPESPAMPTLVSATAEDPPDGYTSYFLADNGAGESDSGTYYYWASAVNDSGESFPSGTITDDSGNSTGVATAVSVAVSAGQVVAVVIGTGASNGQPVTQFRIYRGVVDNISDPTTTIIGHYAVSPVSTPSSVTFIDTNTWRSGCKIALILERTPSNSTIAQLAPLTKYPLAIVQTKVEWLLLLYHVWVIKARQRAFLIKNIGPYNPGS